MWIAQKFPDTMALAMNPAFVSIKNFSMIMFLIFVFGSYSACIGGPDKSEREILSTIPSELAPIVHMENSSTENHETAKSTITEESESESPEENIPVAPEILPFHFTSLDEAYELLKSRLKGFHIVRQDFQRTGWIFDVNNDGADDVTFICLSSNNQGINFEELSNEQRLFNDEYSSLDFTIINFISDGYRQGSNVPRYQEEKMSLGSFRILKYIGLLDFGIKGLPAVQLHFMREDEFVRVWVILKPPVSVVQLVDSSKYDARAIDIDDDGILDIVIADRLFEEGIGEETFLTWMKWNGNFFVEYSSTNVVRNLNSFLHQIAELAEDGNWTRIARHTLRPSMMQALTEDGITGSELFRRIFSLQEGERYPDPELITQVEFQEIYENPFSRNIRSIKIPCRFFTNKDYYLAVTVSLSDNPFIQPQFYIDIE